MVFLLSDYQTIVLLFYLSIPALFSLMPRIVERMFLFHKFDSCFQQVQQQYLRIIILYYTNNSTNPTNTIAELITN